MELEKEEPLTMEHPGDQITVQEIADYFGINRDTAFYLVRSRYFPSIQLGAKTFLIPRTAFMKFVQDPERITKYKVMTEEAVNAAKEKSLKNPFNSGK